MIPIVRLEADPGLLTNRRMALEIGVGIAALTGRRLSMPWSTPIGDAPGPRPARRDDGDGPPLVTDLWEVPGSIVSDEEWDEASPATVLEQNWTFGSSVYLADPDAVPDPGIVNFANGRTRFVRVPPDAEVASIHGRPLAWYSYFFHATGRTRRRLLEAIGQIRLKEPFVELGEGVASELGAFNAVHVRRTDLTKGIRAYAGVSPEHIARTIEQVLPTDEPLVIASEADPGSNLFDPIRDRFPEIHFVTPLLLGDHARGFGALPVNEDNALGAVTQVVATRAQRFVGTMGSTFTGLIHRHRLERDPTAEFLYTADFTPPGPTFRAGRYEDRRPGRYSWNRIGLNLSPDCPAWQREWPESVTSPDDTARLESLPERRGLDLHAVVCTDTNPYGDWQCRFQEHTWERVGNPGELVRLVATPDAQPAPTHRTARVVTTAGRNTHPAAPEPYAGFNRLWSLQEWLATERPTGSVLILDSDFVFRSPVLTTISPGEVVVQRWFDLHNHADVLRDHVTAPEERMLPLTWPMVTDAGDLAALMPRWLDLTATLRRTTGMWESDMFALIGALAETDLTIRFENLGAWMPWPEDFVAGAPIIHYCQAVEDRDGERLWFKQDYRPWEPLDVDPNDARLDYCRDFLHLLDEYVRLRSQA